MPPADWIAAADIAAATVMAMAAALLHGRADFPGRRELQVSLGFGVLLFLIRSGLAATPALAVLIRIGPLAFDRAMRAGFERPQRPAWLDAGLALLLLAGALPMPVTSLAFDALTAVLFGDAAMAAIRGFQDDLVDRRRHLRLRFLAAGAGLGVAVAVVSLLGQPRLAAGLGGMALVLAGLWFAARPPRQRAEPSSPANAVDRAATLGVPEQMLLERLRRAMTDEALHADPNLTLSRLARRLDVSEHGLRRVIHLGEGARNFSEYLNRLRLDAVLAAFADPGQDGAAIADIAFAAGYNSLSVFNRAFRLRQSATPSQVRLACKAARTAKPSAAIAASAEPIAEI